MAVAVFFAADRRFMPATMIRIGEKTFPEDEKLKYDYQEIKHRIGKR